jgi:hypothetical protein
MLPVGGVGLAGIGGTGRFDVAAGAVSQILQMGGRPAETPAVESAVLCGGAECSGGWISPFSSMI